MCCRWLPRGCDAMMLCEMLPGCCYTVMCCRWLPRGCYVIMRCGLLLEICTGSKLKPEPGPYPRSSDPTRPDPSGTVKFKARTRPESPPPPPTTNNKKKEKGCISRLHAKTRINQGSDISQTFTSYESLWTSGAAVAYILPSLWILFGQEDDDRANYHFLSVKAR